MGASSSGESKVQKRSQVQKQTQAIVDEDDEEEDNVPRKFVRALGAHKPNSQDQFKVSEKVQVRAAPRGLGAAEVRHKAHVRRRVVVRDPEPTVRRQWQALARRCVVDVGHFVAARDGLFATDVLRAPGTPARRRAPRLRKNGGELRRIKRKVSREIREGKKNRRAAEVRDVGRRHPQLAARAALPGRALPNLPRGSLGNPALATRASSCVPCLCSRAASARVDRPAPTTALGRGPVRGPAEPCSSSLSIKRACTCEWQIYLRAQGEPQPEGRVLWFGIRCGMNCRFWRNDSG